MLRSVLCQFSAKHSLAIPALRLPQTAALRHPCLSLVRPAPSSSRDALHTRAFSSSPRRNAAEDEAKNAELNMMFTQQQKLLKLLQDKPETMEHIKKFIEQLQANGIDVTSGKMPSKMDMLRLLMKSDIRESAMKMAAAFQEAGIDLQSKEMMQSLMAMQKQLGDK
ncbi:hypothetical protein BN946_scf185043.g165 [Trametes cinnabarina]|uniref:Uncharacterized protein n=1 Tax=Pycnoporus cinnabarinus TaxID=5643 RepID=A0A060SI76_PYCCI|nr:hypothetical protein BN946_scf185043.g165 [Trametes cinnabarina]